MIELGEQERVFRAFEALAAVGERRFVRGEQGSGEPDAGQRDRDGAGAELCGRLVLCGSMGERGGALALAATMAGAAFLGVEVDAGRIKHRLRSGWCDFMVNSADEALRILKNAVRKQENISVGLVGNCAEIFPELAGRGLAPDVVIDATPAEDARDDFVPDGMTADEAAELRGCDPEACARRARAAATRYAEAFRRLRETGAVALDPGEGERGAGVLRWVATSGAARDVAAIDELVLELFGTRPRLRRWIEQARRRIRPQGVAGRICRLEAGERVRLGLEINERVRQGGIGAPVRLEMEGGDEMVADGSVEAAQRMESELGGRAERFA